MRQKRGSVTEGSQKGARRGIDATQTSDRRARWDEGKHECERTAEPIDDRGTPPPTRPPQQQKHTQKGGKREGQMLLVIGNVDLNM